MQNISSVSSGIKKWAKERISNNGVERMTNNIKGTTTWFFDVPWRNLDLLEEEENFNFMAFLCSLESRWNWNKKWRLGFGMRN